MPLNHAQFSSHILIRATCVAVVVGLSAFGVAASAGAATTHIGPIAGSPVTVGAKPVAVAFDDNRTTASNAGHVYVANADGNSVSVIDATTHQVTTTIPLGRNAKPSAIAVDQADDLIFVADYGDGDVAIIDGHTNTVRSRAQVGENPDAIAWDPANNWVYVANYGDGTVTIIDAETGQRLPVGGTVIVGSGTNTSKPEGIAVDGDSNKIVVAAQGDNKVFVIDGTNNVVREATGTFASPNAVAVDPNRHWAYIANFDNKTVSIIDLTTGAELPGSPVMVGDRPNALTINQNTNKVYVANFDSSSISIIDPIDLSVSSGGPVGLKPSGIAVDSRAPGDIYVSNQGDSANPGNSVSILGTTVSPTITTGGPTAGVVGTSYSFPFAATGTPAKITFTATGDLPPGLVLASNVDGSDGTLSGTPTQSGDFTFTLHASNGVDPEATATYTLHIDPAEVTPPTTTPTTPPGGHLPTVAG